MSGQKPLFALVYGKNGHTGMPTAALFAAVMVVTTSALGGAALAQAHDPISCDSSGVCYGAFDGDGMIGTVGADKTNARRDENLVAGHHYRRFKVLLRRAQARKREVLLEVTGRTLGAVTREGAAGRFSHCGQGFARAS